MKSYILVAGSFPKKVIGHTGDLGSFTSGYWVFPETESAVVVLTNSSSADGDSSNLIVQVLMQALFDLQPAIGFVKVASEAVTEAKAGWDRAVDACTENRLADKAEGIEHLHWNLHEYRFTYDSQSQRLIEARAQVLATLHQRLIRSDIRPPPLSPRQLVFPSKILGQVPGVGNGKLCPQLENFHFRFGWVCQRSVPGTEIEDRLRPTCWPSGL